MQCGRGGRAWRRVAPDVVDFLPTGSALPQEGGGVGVPSRQQAVPRPRLGAGSAAPAPALLDQRGARLSPDGAQDLACGLFACQPRALPGPRLNARQVVLLRAVRAHWSRRRAL